MGVVLPGAAARSHGQGAKGRVMTIRSQLRPRALAAHYSVVRARCPACPRHAQCIGRCAT
jgi:hypothetical protein